VYRDVAWRWRAVLPPERQVELEKIAAELGDPDAWRERLFPEEESALTEEDFIERPVPTIVEFLRTWRAEEGERRTQTALAQSLRDAVTRDPNRFAANAALFGELHPIYVRQLIAGLNNATANMKKIGWDGVLALLGGLQDRAGLPEWQSVLVAGVELMGTGLRSEASGLTFGLSQTVQKLILTILQYAPPEPGVLDFEERFERDPYFAALSTLRGIALDTCVLFVWWLSKDSGSVVGRAPRSAFPTLREVAEAVERELTDNSISGRVPRAILGRYLTWLDHFGASWLKLHIGQLFPAQDAILRRAAWVPHLTRDRGPDSDLMFALEVCYQEEIALLPSSSTSRDRDSRHSRLAEYVMLLHIWNPDQRIAILVEQFLASAAATLRGYALSFVGKQAAAAAKARKSHEYQRALSYWSARLSKAASSAEPDAFREEVGLLGQWFAHDLIDDEWLVVQLRELLRAGFVPTQSLLVMRRLATMVVAHPSAVAEVILGLLKNPRTDRWMFFDHGPIRTIFQALLSTGSQNIAQAEEAISILSSRGDTTYVTLLPSIPLPPAISSSTT
jgi:hypothetical protein